MRTSRFRTEVCLLTFLVLLFIYALAETRNLSSDGRVFPLFVTIAGLPIVGSALAQSLWRDRKDKLTSAASGEVSTEADRSVAISERSHSELAADDEIEASLSQSARFWAWFLTFCGALWLFGFYVGVPIAAGAFVLLDSRKSVVKAVATGFIVWLCLYGLFTQVMGIRWPPGVFL